MDSALDECECCQVKECVASNGHHGLDIRARSTPALSLSRTVLNCRHETQLRGVLQYIRRRYLTLLKRDSRGQPGLRIPTYLLATAASWSNKSHHRKGFRSDPDIECEEAFLI